MAHISKAVASWLSVPTELTVAAANLNFDFTLVKVEAPKEYHGVRDGLSQARRSEAEDGRPHGTARRLGALFEALIPPIPHLVTAYGVRASEICSSVNKDTTPREKDLFTSQAGPDGTSIWAAATSGKGALATHLLACILARMWKSHEATSLWVELVERRTKEIDDTFINNGAVEIAAVMAAKQNFDRQELATWDASARAWMQTADASQRSRHMQFMLIINNVDLPVNSSCDPYESVLNAWASALRAMECLVQGISQQVQDGAVLLGISAWHLYPDMEVLGEEIKSISQDDQLLNHSVLTVPVRKVNADREGVFWSLPLSRMRYYSPPIISERRLSSDSSRISMEELHVMLLGLFLSDWESGGVSEERRCTFIISICKLTTEPLPWLTLLSNASQMWLNASGTEKVHLTKLLRLGMRRGHQFFLGVEKAQQFQPLYFGLSAMALMDMTEDVNGTISLLRCVASRLRCIPKPDRNLVIVYQRYDILTDTNNYFACASALPLPRASSRRRSDRTESKRHRRWIPLHPEQFDSKGCTTTRDVCREYLRSGRHENCSHDQGCHDNRSPKPQSNPLETMDEDCSFIDPLDLFVTNDNHCWFATPEQQEMRCYEIMWGVAGLAGLYRWKGASKPVHSDIVHGEQIDLETIEGFLNSTALDPSLLTLRLRHWWVENLGYPDCDRLGPCLGALSYADSIYKQMVEPTINMDVIQLSLFGAHWVHEDENDPDLAMGRAFACVAMFESGEFNIEPAWLTHVIALSVGDSIYVASALISDISAKPCERPIQRVFGNLGRAEMVLLIPPSTPRLVSYNPRDWRVVNHDPFDGRFIDSFAATSLHLSYTDFEMPVDVGLRGLRDNRVIFKESLISINHKGKHIGDLDVLGLVDIQRRCSSCCHGAATRDIPAPWKEKLVSIDNWEELLDAPTSKGIFRASGNWQARMAGAAASLQLGKKVSVISGRACLECIRGLLNSSDCDIIVA